MEILQDDSNPASLAVIIKLKNGRIWLCGRLKYRQPSHGTRWNVLSSTETKDAGHFIECLCGGLQGYFPHTPHASRGMPLCCGDVVSLDGWFFLCVAFGMKFGPLVWGRVAAFCSEICPVAGGFLGAQDASLRGRSDTHRGRFCREQRLRLFTVVLLL